MSRRVVQSWSVIMALVVLLSGCHPTQPFYFNNDGDLSHYLDVATEIKEPDLEQPRLDEVSMARAPLTIENVNVEEMWDLTLEEAMCITLQNSKVIRLMNFAGASSFLQSLRGNQTPIPAQNTIRSRPDAVPTVFDPAITESDAGDGGRPGVEAALSAFDTQFTTQWFWDRRDRRRNLDFQGGPNFPFANELDFRNMATADMELSKRLATGGVAAIRNNYDYGYNRSRSDSEPLPSDYTVEWEFEFRQSLLRGGGTLVNRIPIVIARIRSDIELADFEEAVRAMVRDVESSYWELYCSYRNLEADQQGQESALGTWRKIKALADKGLEGGEADKEAQARQQYFEFRGAVEAGLSALFHNENRLRYIMGIASSDGRLIRPLDEPPKAKVNFDWNDSLSESLVRSVELRRQKWRIKQIELEMIAARNQLLPRLDVVGLYRFVGVGDNLINADRNGLNFPAAGSTAYDELTEGKYTEYRFGFQMDLPVGFRRELARVRNTQLRMAREKAIFEDMELELSHEMASAFRNLDGHYKLAETNFNRWGAAVQEVNSAQEAYKAGTVVLDLLLDAQRRRSDAARAYYRALGNYAQSITNVHFHKGSLLEVNSVLLAEGSWPAKAYWDAHGHARRRDSSYYMDYGFTRPNVISRGSHQQHQNTPTEDEAKEENGEISEELPEPTPASTKEVASLELGEALEPHSKTSSAKSDGANESSDNLSDPTASFDWGNLGFEDGDDTESIVQTVAHDESIGAETSVDGEASVLTIQPAKLEENVEPDTEDDH